MNIPSLFLPIQNRLTIGPAQERGKSGDFLNWLHTQTPQPFSELPIDRRVVFVFRFVRHNISEKRTTGFYLSFSSYFNPKIASRIDSLFAACTTLTDKVIAYSALSDEWAKTTRQNGNPTKLILTYSPISWTYTMADIQNAETDINKMAVQNRLKIKVLIALEECRTLLSEKDRQRNSTPDWPGLLANQDLVKSVNIYNHKEKYSFQDMDGNLILDFVSKGSIGAGSFGTVIEGEDDKNSPVAIKFLKKKLLSKSEIDSFIKEFILVKTLNELQCLHIVNVHDLYRSNSAPPQYLFTMEKAAQNLSTVFREINIYYWHSTNYHFLADCFRQMAAGCLEVSRQGLVHRDIKPNNFLWFGDIPRENLSTCRFTIKLSDFGISIPKNDAKISSEFFGNRRYSAPELGHASNNQKTSNTPAQLAFTEQTDVYAFGCSLFELVTNMPFNTQNLGWLPRYTSSVALYEIIKESLYPNPEKRPGFFVLHSTLKRLHNYLNQYNLRDTATEPTLISTNNVRRSHTTEWGGGQEDLRDLALKYGKWEMEIEKLMSIGKLPNPT